MLRPYAVQIAEWFMGLDFDALPTEVVRDAELRVLDIVGIALEASQRPLGQAVRRGSLAIGSGDAASLIGFRDRAPVAIAALVNGTLAHATDFDDTHITSVMHTSAPVVATALACAEAKAKSGKQLLTWVAGANELNARLGSVAPGGFHARGFHPTSVLGAVTAALIASKSFGLPTASAVAAMGITGSQAAGLLESYEDGTFVKTLHPGWAGHCGITAAHLAAAGFTGPATVLEGRFGIFRSHVEVDQDLDFDVLTESLGERWLALDTAFKPYPCAHAIHPYVDAILELRRQGLRSPHVARIDAPVVKSQQPIICVPREAKLRPVTPTHARASLFYAVAAALELGSLGAEAYEEEMITNPEILELARRIESPEAPAQGKVGVFSGSLSVHLHDGRELYYEQEHSLGTAGNPMARSDLESKFRSNALRCLPSEQVETLIDQLRNLSSLRNVAELLGGCQPR